MPSFVLFYLFLIIELSLKFRECEESSIQSDITEMTNPHDDHRQTTVAAEYI